MAAIDAEIVALEDARDQTAKAQRELAEGRDPAFAAATAALAEGLGREDIQTLLAEARATQTSADDPIVKQIDDARSRALEEETESREQRARLQTLAARRRELEDIEFEFKKSGFDNPRSTFGEDRLVGDILNDFLRGGISAADYWGRWRQSQSWSGGGGPWGGGSRPQGPGPSTPGRGFGGTGGNRNWGRLPGGSGKGFSRPRSGSTGTRKHGGFKTGGGF
jgi:hypothetical protein